MKLTTDVTLRVLSLLNNIYLFIFYVTGVDYEIKLTFCFELVLGTHFDKNFRENQAVA